jgi:hypothetical protein
VTWQVVSPYRPFPAESDEHLALGPFDWEGALGMLRESATKSCGVETYAITDVDTELPVPAFRFETEERRLMLWILEVSLRYLESPAFTRDTVMVSPDALILGDLAPWFTADLGVLVRPEQKHQQSGRAILNQVQWWRVKAKKRLAQFYREALALAKTLPEDVIKWGADTAPLQQLLSPMEVGLTERAGLSVDLIHASVPMESLSSVNINRLDCGLPLLVSRPVLDFRYTRKWHMRRAFDSLFAEVPACN